MLKMTTDNGFKLNRAICLTLIIVLILGLFSGFTNISFAENDNPVDEPDPIEETEYKILLNSMGGAVPFYSIKVTSGGAFGELPVPSRENYTFKGWYTGPYDGVEVKEGDPVEEKVPRYLYARWIGNEVTLTLDPAKAKLDQTEYIVNYGGFYDVLPTPTRKGLVFMGWYTSKIGGKQVNAYDQVTLTNDITLYAKWAPTWYLQTDKKWSRKWYRVRRENSTIGSAGCGPTTMAMVVSSLKNTNVTPVTACKWSRKKGYKAYLSGTKDGFFKSYGKKYGIKVKRTNGGNLRYAKKKTANKYHKQAKKAVQNGNWVIVLAGKGNWTRGSGHFILWYKTEGDYAYIRDSNSTKAGRAKAKVSTLQKQAKRYWIITVPKDKKVS